LVSNQVQEIKNCSLVEPEISRALQLLSEYFESDFFDKDSLNTKLV